MEEGAAQIPFHSSSKRKEPEEETQLAVESSIDPASKKKRRGDSGGGGTWANLDLILALQNKDLLLQRKLEIAFDFITSIDDSSCGRRQAVGLPRLVSFLIDWIQPLLISSEKNRRSSESWDPCLDYRAWAVLGFGLKRSSVGVSPNLLRAVTRIVGHTLVEFEKECAKLFKEVLNCLTLLFSANSRAFQNAGLEIWVSCVVEILNLVRLSITKGESGSVNVEAFLQFSGLLLGSFNSFLRFHPNPKNIFRLFVDRLLEPLLELLVLFHIRISGGKCGQEKTLLNMVEDVLSNGLFHPAHISGFLNIKSSNTKQEGRGLKGPNESYHKHLFLKLEKVIAEKKAVSLGGFGYLLRLFVDRLKGRRGASLASKGDSRSETTDSPEKPQETDGPLFGVFMQFLEPLLIECKRFAKIDISENEDVLEVTLIEGHCMLNSLNEILASFVKEKIYIRSEDTTHFNFLKEVYDIIISISSQVYMFWLAVIPRNKVSLQKILPLIAKEIFVAVGYFLEIEYKVVKDDLIMLWLMIFSYLAVQVPLTDTKPCTLLVSQILKLGCHAINICGELRQVNDCIFALCKAVRLFSGGTADSVGYYTFLSSSLSSEKCLTAVTTLLCSQVFREAISNAIKTIPERQASACINQLKIDINDSLEWIRRGIVIKGGVSLGETSNLNDNILNLCMQAEIFGRVLSEVYTVLLDSLIVTATNSTLVGNSVEDLMKTIRPTFKYCVGDPSHNLESFILSLSGNDLSDCKLLENVSGPVAIRPNLPWILVFFFRLYISCRSLYFQTISLMPPNSSKKASSTLGNLFSICSGMEWHKKPKSLDEGYFSWVVKPSGSLLDVIQSLSEGFLDNSSYNHPELVYVLHVMALQRLNELNRKIEAFEFLQEEDSHVSEMQIENSDSQKSSKRWSRLIISSRKEAVGLTKFVNDYLPLFVAREKSHLIQSNNLHELELISALDEVSWDMGVCSLNKTSVNVGIWWLLCRNIDLWCSHSTTDCVKRFLFHVLQYGSTFGTVKKDVKTDCIDQHLCKKVNMHQIALELLADNLLYEQRVICRNFASRFCRILKKSITPLLDHSSASCKNISSLQETSEDGGHIIDVYSSLSKTNLSMMDMSSIPPYEKQPCPQVKTCENLLHLSSEIFGVCVNAKSFPVYATSLLNFERLLHATFMRCHGKSSTSSCLELLRLFVSCRRAMKHLVVAYFEGEKAMKFSYFSNVFNSSAVLWLLESVHGLEGLLHGTNHGDYPNQMEKAVFSLIQHTSYIFLTISRGHILSTLADLGEENTFDEADQQSDVASKRVEMEKYPGLIAEMLQDQIRDLSANFRGGIQGMELEECIRIVGWSKLSSVISCSQGFLWGLASALDSTSSESYQSAYLKWFSAVSNFIYMLEKFVNLCINILLTDDTEKITNHLTHILTDLCGDNDLSCNALSQGATNPASKCYVGMMAQKRGKAESSSSCCVIDDKILQDKECTKWSKANKGRASYVHAKWIRKAFNSVHEIDLTNVHHLKESFLKGLLRGENSEAAFLLGQLFVASASILKLKCMLPFPRNLEFQSGSHYLTSGSLNLLITTWHVVLQGVAEIVAKSEPLALTWVDGLLRYLEVVGSYINSSDPTLSKDVFAQLIYTHLRTIGICTSFQGKAATLSSHDTGSTTKMLQKDVNCHGKQLLYPGECDLNAFKDRLRMSFINFVKSPTKLHLEVTLQAIERALVGLEQSCQLIYEISTGNPDGGKVSPVVAGGIDGLYLVLEYASGQNHDIKKNISSLVSCLFSIVSHLQGSTIFYIESPPCKKIVLHPDAGSVVLMCVEVLTIVAGRGSLKMGPSQASQCLHVPMALFKDFHELRTFRVDCQSAIPGDSESRSPTTVHHYEVDRQFSVDLYSSCCKLLYTTLKHQMREVKPCLALLQGSVCTLLNCLETFDANSVSRKGYFSWDAQEAVKCASFLRRIYEEIRQQKDAFGEHSIYFLSTYISVYSGFGPNQTGIKKEIDQALRPGIYSLIDTCTESDIQELHTVLGEGRCRNTLSSLINDYRLNFQYEGKI